MKTFDEFLDNDRLDKVGELLEWLPPVLYWPAGCAFLVVLLAYHVLGRYIFVPQRFHS